MNKTSEIDSDVFLYERVAEEIELKQISKGLFTKALSMSNGNQKVAESLYITFRVEKLKQEIVEAEIFSNSTREPTQHSQKDKDAEFKFFWLGGFFWLLVLVLVVFLTHVSSV